MKRTKKELWLFTMPLFVIAFALLLNNANNYLIKQEEQMRLKPSLYSDGSMMVSRHRQPDGSIKELLHERDSSKRLLLIIPASKIPKPKGLFKTRYILQGVGLTLALSLLCLPFLVISSLLRHKRNRS